MKNKNNCSPIINNPCPHGYVDAQCVTYSGPSLPNIGVTTNQRLDKILKEINDHVISPITASNGLTKTLNDISLGGKLIKPLTSIDIAGNQLSFGQLTGSTQGAIQLFSGTGSNVSMLNLDASTSSTTISQGSKSINITSSGMFISDDALTGIRYNGNYEANFVPTSLVTKQYVDGLIPPSLVFSNGITQSGTSVKLGGTLVDPLTIIEAGSTNGFVLGYVSDQKALLGITNAGAQLVYGTKANLQAGLNYTRVQYDPNGDGTASMRLNIDSTDGLVFVDPMLSRGVIYGGDYEANFVPKSLVTKQYVDSAVASAPNFANTNLTLTADRLHNGGNHSLVFNNFAQITERINGPNSYTVSEKGGIADSGFYGKSIIVTDGNSTNPMAGFEVASSSSYTNAWMGVNRIRGGEATITFSGDSTAGLTLSQRNSTGANQASINLNNGVNVNFSSQAVSFSPPFGVPTLSVSINALPTKAKTSTDSVALIDSSGKLYKATDAFFSAPTGIVNNNLFNI